jgi:hypothetical protein
LAVGRIFHVGISNELNFYMPKRWKIEWWLDRSKNYDVNQDRRVRPRLSMNEEEVVENIYHLSASKISPKFQKLMYQLPVELEHGSDDEEE